jgi:hypothetical protein
VPHHALGEEALHVGALEQEHALLERQPVGDALVEVRGDHLQGDARLFDCVFVLQHPAA